MPSHGSALSLKKDLWATKSAKRRSPIQASSARDQRRVVERPPRSTRHRGIREYVGVRHCEPHGLVDADLVRAGGLHPFRRRAWPTAARATAAATSSAAIGWNEYRREVHLAVPSFAASATHGTNSKNWVACTIEYGIGRLRDHVLLGDLRAHVAAAGHPLRADDRQRDVVPDAGLGLRGEQVAGRGRRRSRAPPGPRTTASSMTSTTTSAPGQRLGESFAGERVDAGSRRRGDRLVARRAGCRRPWSRSGRCPR